jgi:CheY-like chemotaxis protein
MVIWFVWRRLFPTTTIPTFPAPMTCILVIDDDRAICDVIKLILVAAGYSVTLAHNGAAGLEAAQRTFFAVALVDLCMPGVNGLEIIRALQESTPRTRLVLISGLISEGGAPDFLGMATNLEGVARLGKPIRRGTLLDVIGSCLPASVTPSSQEFGARVSTAV